MGPIPYIPIENDKCISKSLSEGRYKSGMDIKRRAVEGQDHEASTDHMLYNPEGKTFHYFSLFYCTKVLLTVPSCIAVNVYARLCSSLVWTLYEYDAPGVKPW